MLFSLSRFALAPLLLSTRPHAVCGLTVSFVPSQTVHIADTGAAREPPLVSLTEEMVTHDLAVRKEAVFAIIQKDSAKKTAIDTLVDTTEWDAKNDGLPRPTDSTLVLLTADLVTQFTQVWDVVRHDSATLHDSTTRDSLPFVYRNVINLGFVTLHHFEHGWAPFPNLRRAAEQSSAIAATVRHSDLSPEKLQRIARSCLLAQYDNLVVANFFGTPHYDTTLHLDPTTMAAKNMVFFRTHQQAIESLQLRPWPSSRAR